MVHVSTSDINEPFWNIEARIGMGSTGDDVKFIQYLLARAPEAAQYMPNEISGSSGIAVSDVDGSWGAQTDTAQKWFEQNFKGVATLIADGVVDMIPPPFVGFGKVGNQVFEYKLEALLLLYAIAVNQGLNWTNRDVSATFMDMPNDPQCPGDLVYALQVALNNSTAPSAGADGGSTGG